MTLINRCLPSLLRSTLLTAFFLCPLAVLAQTPAPTNATPDASAPIDITAAVTKGIDVFRTLGATNVDNWFFPPLFSGKIVGYTTNTLRYSTQEVVVAAYKYENYEVMVPTTNPDEPMRKEIRSRIVGRDPSKDYKKFMEVRDPNGPIVHEYYLPIYEKGEANCWKYGGFGNNALAILALRRCGISGDDPLVSVPADNLLKLVDTFGMPDATRDLAGLTAAFAVMPGEQYERMTLRCAAKLMDAQITSGRATGLWGPVAINTKLLSAFLRIVNRFSDEKRALQEQLAEHVKKRGGKGKPGETEKNLQEEIDAIGATSKDFMSEASNFTQIGLRMFDVFGWQAYGHVGLEYQDQKMQIEGLPYLIHNQTTADIESTALAVFALRIAFENGRLPSQTWRPTLPAKPTKPGAPPAVTDLPPARGPREILDLAGRAVLKARTGSNTWSETNIHQPVTDLAWLTAMPQLGTNVCPPLTQSVTVASCLEGASILANIKMMQTPQALPTALENDGCQPLLDRVYNSKFMPTDRSVAQTLASLMYAGALHTKKGKVLRADFSRWNQAADWLTKNQNTNGTWGGKNYVWMPTTSLIALGAVLPHLRGPDMLNNYDKPHLAPGFVWGSGEQYGEWEFNYDTLSVLLFLSDGLPEGWTPPVPEPAAPAPEPAAPAQTP